MTEHVLHQVIDGKDRRIVLRREKGQTLGPEYARCGWLPVDEPENVPAEAPETEEAPAEPVVITKRGKRSA